MTNRSKPLTGLLQWERVDALIDKIRSLGPWYIHDPEKGLESLFVADGEAAASFLAEQSAYIKSRYKSAGWIYVHTPESPSWIKIYNPSKCAGCSISTTPPKAWWEMELEDPRSETSAGTERPKRRSFTNWFK